MSTLFVWYTQEIATNEQKWSLSPEKLQTVLDVSTLSIDKQDEYKAVVSELSTISTSLRNISENPELYIQSWSGSPHPAEWWYALHISPLPPPESTFSTISSLFADPIGWDSDTPEWRLIMWLLSRLLFTNIVLLIVVTTLYYLWIRRVFAPVQDIIDRLRNYIDSARFQTISYHRDDEFAPLVTTINSLYKSLRVQENIRSNFLSDISHEIRTPITAVRCYLDAIEDGMMSLDTKTIPLLQAELSRLTSITEQIMAYESLTHHVTDDIRVERFAIRDQIDLIAHEYLPQLDKNKQVITNIGDPSIHLRMDPGMFVQILHNIFSNFIKYSGTDTRLEIRCTRQKDTINIVFSDDGIGIPTDQISLVREKFYRVDKSRTRDTTMSMGIGLSIIDHIVRIHDGSLDISARSPHGLSISIVIPR
jgi:two-component system, OmpR family, sensor histidine kinase BaeS